MKRSINDVADPSNRSKTSQFIFSASANWFADYRLRERA